MEYAISDIHGHSQTFRCLVEDIIKLKKEDTLYLLGDYVDRGPDSKGVIDYIIELKDKGYQVRTLRGNHEKLFLDSMEDSETYSLFLHNGGFETLASFEIRNPSHLEKKYLDFFNELEYYIETDRFFLVHAGFDFTRNDFLENQYDMLWIRRWHHTINKEALKGKFIVHGHTPIPLAEIQAMLPMKQYPVIDIDGGCFVKKPGFGYLCALNLTTMELLCQERIEEKPDFHF